MGRESQGCSISPLKVNEMPENEGGPPEGPRITVNPTKQPDIHYYSEVLSALNIIIVYRLLLSQIRLICRFFDVHVTLEHPVVRFTWRNRTICIIHKVVCKAA